MHVIYLHGFCSSAQSLKAEQVQRYVKQHPEHSLFLVDLPHTPANAMALIESHIETLNGEQWGVMGSSLGGYYATYLSEKYKTRAVLINPAVKAYTLLEPLLGENKNYHSGDVFELTQEHLSQLKSLYVPTITVPKLLLLLTQTGDEVLDYMDGVNYYKHAQQRVIEGGHHGFDGFEHFLDDSFKHLAG